MAVSPPPPPSITLLAPCFGFPPLPSSHTRSRVSLPPAPSVSFSLPLVSIRMFSVYGLSASLAPEPRPFLLTLALPLTCATPSLFETISLRRLHFFISLSLSSVHRFFALPLLIEKERKMKRMVEGSQASPYHRSSLLAPSVLPRGTVRVVGCEIAKCKWIRDTIERERERDRRIL